MSDTPDQPDQPDQPGQPGTRGPRAKSEKRPASQTVREPRHRARVAAVQMLYQWEVGRAKMDDVRLGFWTGPSSEELPQEHRDFAEWLAVGVSGTTEQLDPMIQGAADNWRIERMNVLDRLILRLAVYEFLHEPETPAKVVINEAIELARTFSGDDAVRFINGVLDAIRRGLQRP